MSDNKKYYYIKVKDNYFERDNIKIMEAQENGYIYSLIILKLYLKSAKYEGRLMMTDRIPYDPSNIETLAKVLNHDIAHVKEAIRMGKELDLIDILNTGEIWMTDIQNFIGHSTTEADRIRGYRKSLSKGISPITSVQKYNKSTPELEIDKEKDLDINKEGHFRIPIEFYRQYADKTTRTRMPDEKDNEKALKLVKKWQDIDFIISLIPYFFDDSYDFFFNTDKTYYFGSFCANIESLISAKDGNIKKANKTKTFEEKKQDVMAKVEAVRKREEALFNS